MSVLYFTSQSGAAQAGPDAVTTVALEGAGVLLGAPVESLSLKTSL